MDSRLLLIVTHLIAFTASQDEESTCKCSSVITTSQEKLAEEIQSQTSVTNSLLGALANETVYDIADESIQKLEKSLNALYGKVETILKPIEMKQEEINKTVTDIVVKSTNEVKKELLTNETVTEIVEKSMGKLFAKVQTLVTAQTQLGYSRDQPATSCKEILRQNKDSLSDHYWLKTSRDTVIEVFCDMTRTCGGITGGWMRVAQLDTTTNPHQCPHPLTRNTQHGKNLCARRETEGGCSEVHYQTNGVAYNEVCGRVIGYQFGSTDGPLGGSIDIDGVSLTHSNPRRHIWTFIAAFDESSTISDNPYTCDCSNKHHRGSLPSSFIGNDYFCDSGTTRIDYPYIFYNDPLWDGAGCSSNSECCTFQNPPWFYKKLGEGTADNIDMRVCRNQHPSDEDVLLEKVDIYVR